MATSSRKKRKSKWSSLTAGDLKFASQKNRKSRRKATSLENGSSPIPRPTGGPEESTADLTMEKDGTISGTITSHRGTASIISGYLSVDKFSFTINIPIEGSPADVIFSGTFDGTSLKGTIRVQDFSLDRKSV